MAATWQKNQITATKRRCALLVYETDGTPAPRGTDFIDLDYVYICGVDSPHFALALGTVTNQRIPLTAGSTDVVETVDTGADTLELTGHAYETGDGPFTADEALGSIGIGTQFWVIVEDVDNIAVAASLADAYSNTRVALTGSEVGATILTISQSQRGVDGHFVYQATQAETNHDAPETIVMVDGGNGTDYDRELGGGAWTSVEMTDSSSDFGSGELENGLSRDDAMRIILRTVAAKFSKTGNDYVFRDMADSKDSHTGTVTTAGRVDADIDDPT